MHDLYRTRVSNAKRSPISRSTQPFSVSFRLSNSFMPFVIVSTFDPSCTRTAACRRNVPDGSRGLVSDMLILVERWAAWSVVGMRRR